MRPSGRAHSPYQAVTALREFSRVLMVTLDAIAELFELTRPGEDCSAEDGDRVAATVENSHAMLRGIAAGFAVADLQAAMA